MEDKEMAKRRVSARATLKWLIVQLGQDHFQQATGWSYFDQRLDYVREVRKRYWSDPRLLVLFPKEVRMIKNRLRRMPKTSKAATAMQSRKFHGKTRRFGGKKIGTAA